MSDQLGLDLNPTEEQPPPEPQLVGEYLTFDDPDLTTTFDLPPKWDGRPVIWDEVWDEAPRLFICPPPKDQHTCNCGSTWSPLMKTGRTSTSMLRVMRCADCHADTIIDPEGKWWDLDPDDYGFEGSYLITPRHNGTRVHPGADPPKERIRKCPRPEGYRFRFL